MSNHSSRHRCSTQTRTRNCDEFLCECTTIHGVKANVKMIHTGDQPIVDVITVVRRAFISQSPPISILTKDKLVAGLY